MKKLNDEQKIVVDDIILNETKDPSKPLCFFLTNCVRMRKAFTLMCIIQNMLQHYIK